MLLNTNIGGRLWPADITTDVATGRVRNFLFRELDPHLHIVEYRGVWNFLYFLFLYIFKFNFIYIYLFIFIFIFILFIFFISFFGRGSRT